MSEWTREELDALIDRLNMTGQFQRGAQGFRDAILASQPERVECEHLCSLDNQNMMYSVPWRTIIRGQLLKFCPDCGQSLKGAGE